MKSEELKTLEQALGYEFENTELIIEALTHRSHYHEHGDSPHNERLELLGDAVLDLCITELIMFLSPESTEGQLSKLRSQLVSESSLAAVARKLDLGPFLRLGKGEDVSGGRDRESMLADLLEAIIAALYQDGGLTVARIFVQRVFGLEPRTDGNWSDASRFLLVQDYKSRLQELCQALGHAAPTYQCVDVTGPDHLRLFTMALMISSKELIRAEGLTKKEATQKAAKALLESLDSNLKALSDHLDRLNIKPTRHIGKTSHELS